MTDPATAFMDDHSIARFWFLIPRRKWSSSSCRWCRGIRRGGGFGSNSVVTGGTGPWSDGGVEVVGGTGDWMCFLGYSGGYV